MKRLQYTEPRTEFLTVHTPVIICDSPESGGIENIQYEDWVSNDSYNSLVE